MHLFDLCKVLIIPWTLGWKYRPEYKSLFTKNSRSNAFSLIYVSKTLIFQFLGPLCFLLLFKKSFYFVLGYS